MKHVIVAIFAAVAVSLAGPAFGQAAQGQQTPPQGPGTGPSDMRQGPPGTPPMHGGMGTPQSQETRSQQLQQMIERDLVQAGLPQDRASAEAGKLARELDRVQQDFTSRLGEIGQRYAGVLSSGATPEPQAQQQAQQVVGHVARITPEQLRMAMQGSQAQAAPGQAPAPTAQQAALPAQAEGLSEPQKQRIAQRLRESGVDPARIEALSKQGFPEDETREALETAMVEKAEERADQVMQQIEREQTGGQP